MSDRIPTYRKKRTAHGNYAVVTLPDGYGGRRELGLGIYGTKESKAEYALIIAEWEANGRHVPTTAADLTIAELIECYWPVVDLHYRLPDSTPTSEVSEYRQALRVLNHLYGPTPAKQFGPLALKAVRDLMVKGYAHPKYGPQGGLARSVTNKRIARIKHMVKWAVSNELLPAGVYHGLLSVEGLRRGHSAARETEPVKPVPRAIVERTLPVLRPTVADMVRLQLETGMRSGELVIMRPIDIDMTGKVWLYRPRHHKTEHHGHERAIVIGPRAQQIIRKYLTTDTQAYLFSPARDMELHRQELRAQRKSRVQPSQTDRSKKRPKLRPKERYTVDSYRRSIANAINLHNAKCEPNEQLPQWHPHQLRHLRALELQREAGLEATRAVLGHRTVRITQHYAGVDLARAAEVMAKIG